MIKIKTRIHESCSGRGVTVQREYITGPRNLLRAFRERSEISQEQTLGWGNIGHCGTWIELNGILVSEDDISAVSQESCKNLIENVTSGKLQQKRREYAIELELIRKYENDCNFAGFNGLPKPPVPIELKNSYLAEYMGNDAYRFGAELCAEEQDRRERYEEDGVQS